MFAVAVCAALVFLRMHGGMQNFSGWWFGIGLGIAAVYLALTWILSPPGHPEKPRRGDGVRRVLAAPPLRVLAGLCYGGMFIMFMVAFTSAITGRSGSLLIAALSNLPMGLMTAGVSILGGAFLRRQGPPHCAKCRYDLSGPPEGGYDVCPECGTDVRAPAAVVRERREMHRGVLAVGVLLAAAPFAWFFFAFRSPVLSMGWYLPAVSTASLIAEVTGAPRGFTMNEWAELATRTLTPAQEQRLFEGLLALRAGRGFIDPGAEAFLARVAESGTIPASLRERYYSEMISVRLTEPTPGIVAISSEYTGPYVAGFVQTGVVATGFEVGGAAARAGAGPTVEILPEDWHGGDTLTVRARGWVYALPSGSAPLPARAEVPEFPAGTLWMRPIDVSITLRK